jgi:hypothetical protein
MTSAERTFSWLMLCLFVLTGCATPLSIAAAPTPTLTARQPAVEAAPSDRVVLAAGHYQLLMLYSPL